MTAPTKARRGYENETPERARESVAKLCEAHLSMPLRSKDTLSVREHYTILRAIRDHALKGQVIL